MKNINSVMGFNKYSNLRQVAETMLAEKKAEKLENENLRKEYEALGRQKHDKETLTKSQKHNIESNLRNCSGYNSPWLSENKPIHRPSRGFNSAD